MSFLSNLSELYERASNLVYSSVHFISSEVEELLSRLRDINEEETEREEKTEIFAGVEDDDDDEYGVLADLDEAYDRQEAELYQVEAELSELEDEQASIYDNFPDWMSHNLIDEIIEATGVTTFDDLFETERDEFAPGWRGYEEADEPALEIDAVAMREEFIAELGIPPELESYLSNDELLNLTTSFGNIGLAREFEELSPEEIEEASRNIEDELTIIFQSEWQGWIEFYNSPYYDVWAEHPDLFELYKSSDGHIEMYKVKDT